MQQNPDRELVEAAIAGNAESFTELCSRYYAAMVAIARSVLGDRHLAEDAAQQTFATAAFKLPQLKNKDKFAAWLGAICRNTTNDMAGAKEELRTPDQLSSTPAATKDSSSFEPVRAAIMMLPAQMREVIFLRYYDGMTYETIGKVLGISEQAINGRLRRAKKKLAKYLTKQGLFEV